MFIRLPLWTPAYMAVAQKWEDPQYRPKTLQSLYYSYPPKRYTSVWEPPPDILQKVPKETCIHAQNRKNQNPTSCGKCFWRFKQVRLDDRHLGQKGKIGGSRHMKAATAHEGCYSRALNPTLRTLQIKINMKPQLATV